MEHNQARKIAEAIGATEMMEALGVSSHSIRQAKFAGAFPASWYAVIRGMCVARGISCPEGAFKFKAPANTDNREAAS